ncbi:hypothetical protein FACS1894111_00060 [Clostridia bacterium]|nr:hypothetical protein FACS1894111_00060 [Clostridia bacterium]
MMVRDLWFALFPIVVFIGVPIGVFFALKALINYNARVKIQYLKELVDSLPCLKKEDDGADGLMTGSQNHERNGEKT